MRLRATMTVVALSLILVAVIDGGSVLLARVAVTDDAKDAGRAAVVAIEGQPVNGRTATIAYAAAEKAAAENGELVRQDDFLVHADGSVELTLTRIAPTLVFNRLSLSRDWTTVGSTWIQKQIGP